MNSQKIRGRTTNPWANTPSETVTMNNARLSNVLAMSFICANCAAIKLIMPNGAHLKHGRFEFKKLGSYSGLFI